MKMALLSNPLKRYEEITLNFLFWWEVENKEGQLKGLPPSLLVFSFASPPAHNDIVES